jgi:hypothetical protein
MFNTGRTCGFIATGQARGATDWYDNPYAFDQAVIAATTILEAFRPKGSIEVPTVHQAFATAGEGFANGLLEQVARGAARTGDDIQTIESIKEELGPLRDRIVARAVGPQTKGQEEWSGKKRSKRAARPR